PLAGYTVELRPKSAEYDKLVSDGGDDIGPVFPGSADVLLTERQRAALPYRFLHEILKSYEDDQADNGKDKNNKGGKQTGKQDALEKFVTMVSNFPQYRGALAGVGTHGLERETPIESEDVLWVA
ncbi:unnamed protein product, partial [Amoebophrya sp. A25]